MKNRIIILKARRNWGQCCGCEDTIKEGNTFSIIDGEFFHEKCIKQESNQKKIIAKQTNKVEAIQLSFL